MMHSTAPRTTAKTAWRHRIVLPFPGLLAVKVISPARPRRPEIAMLITEHGANVLDQVFRSLQLLIRFLIIAKTEIGLTKRVSHRSLDLGLAKKTEAIKLRFFVGISGDRLSYLALNFLRNKSNWRIPSLTLEKSKMRPEENSAVAAAGYQ